MRAEDRRMEPTTRAKRAQRQADARLVMRAMVAASRGQTNLRWTLAALDHASTELEFARKLADPLP